METKKKPTNNQRKLSNMKKQPKLNDDIKIYSLGGLGVIGMNMYVVEQNNEILIIDA